MFPKIIAFSVDVTFNNDENELFYVRLTLTEALIFAKSCGARVIGNGFSTSFKSPNVASSKVTD